MIFDDLVDGLLGGTVWELGVAAVAGAVLLAGKGGRPLAKQAIKGYLEVRERTREWTSETADQLHDIYEGAQAELAEVVEELVGDTGDDADLRTTGRAAAAPAGGGA
jgi:hypothetical protein